MRRSGPLVATVKRSWSGLSAASRPTTRTRIQLSQHSIAEPAGSRTAGLHGGAVDMIRGARHAARTRYTFARVVHHVARCCMLGFAKACLLTSLTREPDLACALTAATRAQYAAAPTLAPWRLYHRLCVRVAAGPKLRRGGVHISLLHMRRHFVRDGSPRGLHAREPSYISYTLGVSHFTPVPDFLCCLNAGNSTVGLHHQLAFGVQGACSWTSSGIWVSQVQLLSVSRIWIFKHW